MCQVNKMPVLRERLNQLLNDSGKTIVAFAEFLGTARQTLGYYLNGSRVPDAKMVRLICEKCNVSADWLLGLSDVRVADIEMRGVAKRTGLEEGAIEALEEIDKNILNIILTDLDAFWYFDCMIEDIKKAKDVAEKEILITKDMRVISPRGFSMNEVEYYILHAGKCAQGIAETITGDYKKRWAEQFKKRREENNGKP